MSNELKPCPFCGGEAKMWFCDPTGRYARSDPSGVWHGMEMTHKYVCCGKCGVRTKVYATNKGAFNAWNRRVNDEQIH